MSKFSDEVVALRKACECLLDLYFDPELPRFRALKIKEAIDDTIHAMSCLRAAEGEPPKEMPSDETLTEPRMVKLLRPLVLRDPPGEEVDASFEVTPDPPGSSKDEETPF